MNVVIDQLYFIAEAYMFSFHVFAAVSESGTWRGCLPYQLCPWRAAVCHFQWSTGECVLFATVCGVRVSVCSLPLCVVYGWVGWVCALCHCVWCTSECVHTSAKTYPVQWVTMIHCYWAQHGSSWIATWLLPWQPGATPHCITLIVGPFTIPKDWAPKNFQIDEISRGTPVSEHCLLLYSALVPMTYGFVSIFIASMNIEI